MQLVQGMSIKDCQEGDQRATEVDSEDASMNHMPDLWIKVKQSEVKRYGALSTCLASRAVHKEVSHSMTTDSFIQGLRRMITRRGNVRQILSDNGPNLVRAEQELILAFNEMDKNADWIKWKGNPPAASHMGGIWECQIWSARGILASLLQTHGHSLDEESLQTLVAKTEAVINSQPLTVETMRV